jgi:hypothetical protein
MRLKKDHSVFAQSKKEVAARPTEEKLFASCNPIFGT